MLVKTKFTWTPTQQRIMDVLGDGLPHGFPDLLPCLEDEYAERGSIRVHLCNMRAKLRPEGLDILIQSISRKIHYRLVRLISPQEI